MRNLKIAKAPSAGDAIKIQVSHHIWIDHCDLSSDRTDTTSGYDGLVDITHGSQFVTVSWTLFHDHKDTSLVGHTPDAMSQAEDQNLSVTYHHNLFLDVDSGPRVRWGMAHVFSNHFQDVTVFGVVSQSEATVQVDHNVFDSVDLPIATTYLMETPGFMAETGNKFTPGFSVDIAPPLMPIVVALFVLVRLGRQRLRDRLAVRGHRPDQGAAVAAAGARSESRYSMLPLPPVIGDVVSAPTS